MSQEVHVVPWVRLVNGDDLESGVAEVGEPLLRLLGRPVLLHRRHVVERLGRDLLERPRAIHGGERPAHEGGGLAHLGAHLGDHRCDVVVDGEAADLLKHLAGLVDQLVGCWVILGHDRDGLSQRLAWRDTLCRLADRRLVTPEFALTCGFDLRQGDVDHLAQAQHRRVALGAQGEVVVGGRLMRAQVGDHDVDGLGGFLGCLHNIEAVGEA